MLSPEGRVPGVTGLNVASLYDGSQQLYRIFPNRFSQRYEFRNSHLSLLGFDHADDGVWSRHPLCEVALRETFTFASLGEDGGNRSSRRASQSLQFEYAPNSEAH
jgi:hypothetical protein